jgi:hypothetical protein
MHVGLLSPKRASRFLSYRIRQFNQSLSVRAAGRSPDTGSTGSSRTLAGPEMRPGSLMAQTFINRQDRRTGRRDVIITAGHDIEDTRRKQIINII